MNVARLATAFAGFAAALLAVAFESRTIGWIAAGCLAVSVAVRLLIRRRPPDPPASP